MRIHLNLKQILLVIFLFVNVHYSFSQSQEEKLSNANSLLFENHFEKALHIYEELIKETPDSVTLSYIYGYSGSCYENLNNDSMAIEFYKKAILCKTGELAIFNKLYSLAKKKKDIENQEFALKSEASIFSFEKQRCFLKLAYLYAENRQFEKLVNTTELLTETDSTIASYYYLKGFGLENLGEKDKAESSYKKAVDLDPKNYAANVGLGFLLYNKATIAFDKEQARYGKIKEPTWRHHMTYMEEVNKVRKIYDMARPYLEKACSLKCTGQIKQALEVIESRSKKDTSEK